MGPGRGRACQARASSSARATCAAHVDPVRPRMAPRASARQCGASSPLNAGTKNTPARRGAASARARGPTRQACGSRARASGRTALLCRRARHQAPARGAMHAAGACRHAGALLQDSSPEVVRVTNLHQRPCPGRLEALARTGRAPARAVHHGWRSRLALRHDRPALQCTGGLGDGRARGLRAPAVPSTLRASGSSSSTPPMRPRPSRSQDTAAPAVAIAPCARARARACPTGAAVPVTGPQGRARCAAAGAPVSPEPAASTRGRARERARPCRERPCLRRQEARPRAAAGRAQTAWYAWAAPASTARSLHPQQPRLWLGSVWRSPALLLGLRFRVGHAAPPAQIAAPLPRPAGARRWSAARARTAHAAAPCAATRSSRCRTCSSRSPGRSAGPAPPPAGRPGSLPGPQ